MKRLHISSLFLKKFFRFTFWQSWPYGRHYICTNYLIPVGKNNRYGHPNKEVLENLKDSKIYRTDQNGSVMFKIKKNKLQVEACSP